MYAALAKACATQLANPEACGLTDDAVTETSAMHEPGNTPRPANRLGITVRRIHAEDLGVDQLEQVS